MGGGLDFSLDAIEGDFTFFNGYFDPIKRAATAAMRDVTEIAKERGRADIARAGFGKRWQNALRGQTFPKGKTESVNAAAWLYHRIPYAGVFEEGATIRGRPRLWVPFSHTPKLGRRKRLNPRNFEAQYGKLVPMTGARQPLLGAKIGVTPNQARRGPPYRVTRASLRRGASGQGVIRTAPVFVGVDTVRIRKRFNLAQVFEDAGNQIAARYLANLEA